MESANFRSFLTDAIRYWEPRRLLYNAALSAIVLTYFALGYPSSRAVVSLDFILMLFLLAVLANVAYCAAYVVDLFAQSSTLRERWLGLRWVLLAIGITFAGIITRFLVMGMFQLNSR